LKALLVSEDSDAKLSLETFADEEEATKMMDALEAQVPCFAPNSNELFGFFSFVKMFRDNKNRELFVQHIFCKN
jgi:hypothetical protein